MYKCTCMRYQRAGPAFDAQAGSGLAFSPHNTSKRRGVGIESWETESHPHDATTGSAPPSMRKQVPDRPSPPRLVLQFLVKGS